MDLVVESIHTHPFEENGLNFWLNTQQGDRIVWMTKRKPALSVGDRIQARFVIKFHLEFRGVEENHVKNFHIMQVYNRPVAHLGSSVMETQANQEHSQTRNPLLWVFALVAIGVLIWIALHP